MCDLLALLKSTATSPATQKKQGVPVPKPAEAVHSSNVTVESDHGAQVLRTTKVPQDMFEFILNELDKMIQQETLNPTRHANIQLCRDFVAEHGFPEEDHNIRVKDGVVRVLAEEEHIRLPRSPRNEDNFLLCAPEWEMTGRGIY